MASSTLTTKGQVTVPKKIREHLHLATGDRLEFVIEEDGGVRLEPVRRSLAELVGLLEKPGRRPVTVEEMDEAIARHHRRRVDRS